MGSAASSDPTREDGRGSQVKSAPPPTFATTQPTQHPLTTNDSSKPHHHHHHHLQHRKLSRRNSGGAAGTPRRALGNAEALENSPIYFAMVANDELPSTNTRITDLQYVSEQSGIVPSATSGIIPLSLKRPLIRAAPAAAMPLGLPTAIPHSMSASSTAAGGVGDARNSPPSQLVPHRPRADLTPLSGSLRHSSTTSSYAIAQDTISLMLPSGGSVGCGSLYDTEGHHPPLLLVPSPMTATCAYDGQYEIPASPRPTSRGGSGGGLLQFHLEGSCGDIESASSASTVPRYQQQRDHPYHSHSYSQQHYPTTNNSSGTTPCQAPPSASQLHRYSRQHHHHAASSSSMRSLSYHGTPTSHPDPHLFELMSSWSTAPSVDARSTIDMLRASMTQREHSHSLHGESISPQPPSESAAITAS